MRTSPSPNGPAVGRPQPSHDNPGHLNQPQHKRNMQRGPTTRAGLYPDLKEFYREGVVETGSSVDLPFAALVPTAPPPSESSFDLQHSRHPHDHRCNLDLNITVPEEPELDYTFEIEPDYDLDDPAVHVDRLTLTAENLNNLNLNASEKKLLHDKNIEVPQQPRDTRDFRAWMTWRLQANKLLAAVILIRKGHHVHIRRSEIRRKPLTKQNVQTIVQEAKGGGSRGGEGGGGGGSQDMMRGRDRAERTSLSGCPYIMYGIPRVKLSTAKR
ncbi:uncharacterized protein [Littorina saxatilis]|uniref:Uncharacterized protein n=1 Tax=Littorina saxatilis TaxID=31220 RepID=A0AAN9B9C2_9CAEN